MHNSRDSTYTTLQENAWYQDSIGITQTCGIFTEETDTSRTVIIKTIKYRFVDLRNMWAYEYRSFSDTATILRKFKRTDSADYSGGWNFVNRTPRPIENFNQLPDTTINTIQYKRYEVVYAFNDARFKGIGWFRCDKKPTYFQIDTELSNKVGCPLTYFRFHPIQNSNSGIDLQVNFTSTQFPHSVARVFEAWKKNERLYPVQ